MGLIGQLDYHNSNCGIRINENLATSNFECDLKMLAARLLDLIILYSTT